MEWSNCSSSVIRETDLCFYAKVFQFCFTNFIELPVVTLLKEDIVNCMEEICKVIIIRFVQICDGSLV